MATTIVRPPRIQRTYFFPAQVVPNALTDVVTQSCLLLTLLITNVSAGVARFTLRDRQGAPRALGFSSTPIGPNGNVMLEDKDGVLALNGFSWQSDTLNALEATVEYMLLNGA